MRRSQQLITYSQADCTGLQLFLFLEGLMKLFCSAESVQSRFAGVSDAKPSSYLICPYFLKATGSSLFGWYLVHIFMASVICLQSSSLFGITFELLHFIMKLQKSIQMHLKARLLFLSTHAYFLSGQALYNRTSLAFRFWPILKSWDTELMSVCTWGQV